MTMKNVIVAILLLSLQQNLYAQRHAEIPYAVKLQFMEDYISAAKVKWMKHDTTFTALFFHQSHYKRATYTADGRLLAFDIKLTSVQQLPTAVRERITKKFKAYIIDIIWMSHTPDQQIVKFLIHKNERNFELTFDVSGKLKAREAPVISKLPFS